MKTCRSKLAAAALLCLGLAQPVRSLAATHQLTHFKFSGLTADANFGGFDSTGCVFTAAFVSATNGRNLMSGGPQLSSSVFVAVSQFDVCSLTDLLESSGFANLPAGALQLDKGLNSGSLNTAVQVLDFVTNSPFNVDISLSWTGTGAISATRNHMSVREPGLRINDTITGDSRQAATSGSITGMGIIFSLPSEAFAELTSGKEVDLFVPTRVRSQPAAGQSPPPPPAPPPAAVVQP